MGEVDSVLYKRLLRGTADRGGGVVRTNDSDVLSLEVPCYELLLSHPDKAGYSPKIAHYITKMRYFLR